MLTFSSALHRPCIPILELMVPSDSYWVQLEEGSNRLLSGQREKSIDEDNKYF